MKALPPNLQALVGQYVRFTRKSGELEAYVEENICGQIISIKLVDDSEDPRERVYLVEVDYSKFDETNKQYESSNYYDGNGRPTLTAREAGYYTVVEKLCVGDNFDRYVEIIVDPSEKIVGVSIKRGDVVVSLPRPYRHHHLHKMLAYIGEDTPIDGVQGFWTSNQRFVDRVEGKAIAIAANQYKAATDPNLPQLYSEDLW